MPKAASRAKKSPTRSSPDASVEKLKQKIAALQAVIGAGAALLDPHLAAADDAVDMCFRHALEMAHQVIVQPLTRAVVVDR